jgi:formate dehydrogenase maturation protein FdhE
MAAVLTTTDIWADRRRRVAQLRARHGYARQLLDFYGALLEVQETSFRKAAEAAPPSSQIASFAAEVVAPSLIDVSVALGPERMRSELIRHLGVRDARQMIEAWMRGDDQPPVERFLARAVLGPVLEALPEARAACDGPRDALHCPDCSGPPQLSYFAPAPEDLATGRRQLLCARCGKSWGYARMRCPGCGEETSAKLPIYSEMGTTSGERGGGVVRGLTRPASSADAVFPHVRIEACETCHRYLLSFDLDVDRDSVPVVDEIGALPLDLYARERGFTKITTNLMGF